MRRFAGAEATLKARRKFLGVVPRIRAARVRDVFAARRPATLAEKDVSHAVLAPFTADDEATLLFTLRARALQRFAGEMSFPGGRRDRGDTSLVATALREVEEEIAVPRSHVEIVGRLDDRVAYGGHRIRPFVGFLAQEAHPAANPREVERVFTLPLWRFLDRGVYEARALANPRGAVEPVVHYFHLPEATVWGMTGRMVAELLELLAHWKPPRAPDVIRAPEDFVRGLGRDG